MTTHYCRHRRPRRLLATLFVTALMLTALGVGLLRGSAQGHADALNRIETTIGSCTIERSN